MRRDLPEARTVASPKESDKLLGGPGDRNGVTFSGSGGLPPRGPSMGSLKKLEEAVRPAVRIPDDSAKPVVVLPASTASHEKESSVEFKGSQSLYALKFPDSKVDLTAENEDAIADPISMIIVFVTILVSEAARGLLLPSQWPYLEQLGGGKQALGILVGSFSFGRMLATIPLGFLSDHWSMKNVLALAGAIQVVGHLMYVLATDYRFLIFTRIIVGLGSATMSVCRAHVTRSTSKSQRTYYFAYLSALQFVGFAVLPGLGGFLAWLPEFRILGWIDINEFTYPAVILVFANLLCVASLYIRYHDPPSEFIVPGASKPLISKDTKHAVINMPEEPAKPDFVALLTCLFINVCFRGIVAELETVAAPVLMEYFGLSLSSSSFDIGILGFFGLFLYLGFKPIAKRFSDRTLVFFALLVAAGGSMLLFQPFFRPSLTLYSLGLGLIWSIAYPIGQTAILSLFSKVLSGLPAGGFLGVFSATGSLARVVFALVAACIWDLFGKRAVFFGISFISLATFIFGLTQFRRLTPPS